MLRKRFIVKLCVEKQNKEIRAWRLAAKIVFDRNFMIDIQTAYEKHKELIRMYAQVALHKMRKPTVYSLDDLVQEGFYALIRAKNSYEENKCAFTTFLVLCLRQHFYELVSKSYRDKSRPALIDSSDEISFPLWTDCGPLDLLIVKEILASFTKDEMKYIDTLFSFSHRPKKYRRKLTRDVLQLSREREQLLRKNIFDKIKND